MMTAAAVEAKSLSALTTLAADPPLRPHNAPLDPVTLYIARVPGSKDVFLTPLKPRQKVVTAEDVESSLYYVHVYCEDDERVLSPLHTGVQSVVDDAAHTLPSRPPPDGRDDVPKAPCYGVSQISHHPLPPVPPYPLDDGPPRLPHYPNNGIAPFPIHERPPKSLPFPNDHEPPTIAPPFTLRPSNEFTVPRRKAPDMPKRKPVASPSVQPLTSPPLPSPLSDVQLEREFYPESIEAMIQQPQHEFIPQFTLIRRNPATGEQWNVASISDPPVFDVASGDNQRGMTSTRVRKSGQPLYLSISNPGYLKFVSHDKSAPPLSPFGSTPPSTYFDDMANGSEHELAFSRRMWLEGSLLDKKEKNASSRRKSLSINTGPLSPTSEFDSRLSSDFASLGKHTYGNFDFAAQEEPNMHRLSIEHDQKRSNTRGYTFLSPWSGRCEFSSGVSGNSLKCRHLHHRHTAMAESVTPRQVSELRFNLPGGGPLASSDSRQKSPTHQAVPGEKSESRRKRFMSKLSSGHGRSSSDITAQQLQRAQDESEGIAVDRLRAMKSMDFREPSRLDLSLGQELAGGGFAGKQAKLGKLIIEGEGLMMMDLLVAANMGLWFRAYEKQHQIPISR